MIVDKISNAVHYLPLVKNLDNALHFLQANPLLAAGRHEFEGGFVLVTEGTSLPIAEKEFEAHRNYADVMFVLGGSETVSYCPTEVLDTVKEYDAKADCSMHTGMGKDIIVTVPEGYFYIVMPGEGHKPCVHVNEPVFYQKYIIKCKQ